MTSLQILAPAKLNLFLHVTGKRSDGYHLLDSLVAFMEFGDIVDIKRAEGLTISLAGSLAHTLLATEQDNLVMRAARLLQAHSRQYKGAHITLYKHIPVGAGLGGGSADAAATLRGLAQLWGMPLNATDLEAIAFSLGSDIPICVRSQAAIMRGVGEQLTCVTMASLGWIVLVNPGMPLLTADVFKRFNEDVVEPITISSRIDSFDNLLTIMQKTYNMLEPSAIRLLPVIGDILMALRAEPGCQVARMSGSGATCFGLFKDEVSAQQAMHKLQRQYPSWWMQITQLREENDADQTQ